MIPEINSLFLGLKRQAEKIMIFACRFLLKTIKFVEKLALCETAGR